MEVSVILQEVGHEENQAGVGGWVAMGRRSYTGFGQLKLQMIMSRRQADLLKPQERMVRSITTNLVSKDIGTKVLAQENGCMEKWGDRGLGQDFSTTALLTPWAA